MKIFAVAALSLCLVLPVAAKPRPHAKPLSLKQQIAQRDRVIADLRSQVQYLSGEVAHLRGTNAGGGSAAVFSPAPSAPMTADQTEAMLTDSAEADRMRGRRYLQIHGNPPDGDPSRTNPYIERVLAIDGMLVDFNKRRLAGLPLRVYSLPPEIPDDPHPKGNDW